MPWGLFFVRTSYAFCLFCPIVFYLFFCFIFASAPRISRRFLGGVGNLVVEAPLGPRPSGYPRRASSILGGLNYVP